MKQGLLFRAILLLAASSLASTARAEMVLSQVIVDLEAKDAPRDDIEIWNSGGERMYVQAEPFEILAAGTAGERRVSASDPETSGLLVSPQRLVLAPGERRTVRIAAIGGRPDSDRIFRVAIRPVTGGLVADGTAIKVLVGYDALVIVRPSRTAGDVVGERRGNALVLRNQSNTSHEVFAGLQCSPAGGECRDLPAMRLYPGAVWQQALPFDAPVKYKTAVGDQVRQREF